MSNRRAGFSTIYLVFVLTALIAVSSLAVDWGRVQAARTELQRTVDAAARAAAAALPDVAATRAAAKAMALVNPVDDGTVTLKNADIDLGRWDSTTRTFTELTGAARANANSVRITAILSAARHSAIPMTFARFVGWNSQDLTAVAIATYVRPIEIDQDINATDNPWLAGMPEGTVANPINPHSSPDSAPAQTPSLVTNLPIISGQALTFDSIAGNARHDPNLDMYEPDGNLSNIVNNYYGGGAEHGKSDLLAPINALVGVFLGPDMPDPSKTPSRLEFDTDQKRDFNSLAPKLNQTFFIGDGQTGDGVKQQFIVPEGATRLFLGMMDQYEWNNNYGWRKIKVSRPGQVQLVR